MLVLFRVPPIERARQPETVPASDAEPGLPWAQPGFKRLYTTIPKTQRACQLGTWPACSPAADQWVSTGPAYFGQNTFAATSSGDRYI